MADVVNPDGHENEIFARLAMRGAERNAQQESNKGNDLLAVLWTRIMAAVARRMIKNSTETSTSSSGSESE